MDRVGIEFTMKKGGTENFDPLIYPSEFEERELDYYFQLTNGHYYSMLKEDVESFRTYELCPNCGYETGKDGCSNFNCSLYIVY